MYSEQMMREQGFDDEPALPGRACTPTRSGGRAGSSSTSGCTAASSTSTRRPTSWSSTPASSGANAAAEVQRYTYTPDLPAVVPARQGRCCSSSAPTSSAGSATRSRFGRSTTRCCATARCRSASTAACSPARVAERRARHPGDRPRGRPLAGRLLARRRRPAIGAPDRPARAHRRAPRGAGRAGSSTSSTSTARGAAPRPTSRRSARSPRRIAVPLQLAGGLDSAEAIQLAFAAGATRVVLTTAIADRPDDLRGMPRRRRRLARGRARPAAGAAGRVPVASRRAADARRPRRRARSAPASRRLVAGPRRHATRTSSGCVRSFGRTMPRSSSPAGSATSTASAALRDTGAAGSSSARRSSPGPSTFPPPWRPPHDPRARPLAALLPLAAAASPSRRRMRVPAPAGDRLERRLAERCGRRGRVRRAGACPTQPARPLPAGETRTVTIETAMGRSCSRSRPTCRRSRPATSSRSPSAASTTASSSTASCPGFVIQGGDPDGHRARAAPATRSRTSR